MKLDSEQRLAAGGQAGGYLQGASAEAVELPGGVFYVINKPGGQSGVKAHPVEGLKALGGILEVLTARSGSEQEVHAVDFLKKDKPGFVNDAVYKCGANASPYAFRICIGSSLSMTVSKTQFWLNSESAH